MLRPHRALRRSRGPRCRDESTVSSPIAARHQWAEGDVRCGRPNQTGVSWIWVDGAQHTAALQGVTCVDDIATRYFTDLALPPEGTRCTAATPR